MIYKSTTAAMAEPVVEMADTVPELDSVKNCELPDHLKDLFSNSTNNLYSLLIKRI